MKLILQLILLLFVSSHAFAGLGNLKKSGVVSNAMTGEPISDAYVVVAWDATFGLGHGTTQCFRSRFVATGKSGDYLVSGWVGVTTLLGPSNPKAKVYVYKPGYISPPYGSEFYDREQKDDLVPFSGSPQERLKYLGSLSLDMYCGYEDKEILPVYKAMYNEMRSILSGGPNDKTVNALCERIVDVETRIKGENYNLNVRQLRAAEYLNDKYSECLQNKHFLTAMGNKNFQLAESMLDNGLDPNRRDNEKSLYSPIWKSRHLSQMERIKFLVLLTENGGNPYLKEKDNSPVYSLSRAANKQDNDEYAEMAIALIIASGKNAYFSDLSQNIKYRALHDNKRIDIVDAYIAAGMDIDEPIYGMYNILFYSVRNPGTIGITEFILEKEPNVNYQDGMGRTALSTAVYGGNLQAVRLLIERGADVNLVDRDGRAPLHRSSERARNLHIAKLLVEKGADINLADKRGQTALHRAAMSHKYDIVVLLLDSGADVTITDDIGKTARWYAANASLPTSSIISALDEAKTSGSGAFDSSGR